MNLKAKTDNDIITEMKNIIESGKTSPVNLYAYQT